MKNKKKITFKRGLYTDNVCRTVVYAYDVYKDYWSSVGDTIVEFQNIRSHKQYDLNQEEFENRYPHKISKIVVEFKD